jgi:hypothetical protein
MLQDVGKTLRGSGDLYAVEKAVATRIGAL